MELENPQSNIHPLFSALTKKQFDSVRLEPLALLRCHSSSGLGNV